MWLEKIDCQYWRDEIQCEIHWDTKHRCRNCASYKKAGDDMMVSLYDQLQKDFENVDLTIFENFDIYIKSFETSGMNANYDIFVKECKIQDAKIEGLTEEVERRTNLYKEFLDEIKCPYEDVFVSLYNGLAENCGRVNIKSTFSKDEDGNWINKTGEVLLGECPYIFDGYIPNKPNADYWISVPEFI